MTDINRVVLIGRLTRDAELKFTNSGVPVTKFSVAVNRSRKSGDQWEEEVSYIDIVLWGKLGESLNKYLQKGKQVAIEGEIRQNRWEQDGQTRSKIEIYASNVQLLGGMSQGGASSRGDFKSVKPAASFEEERGSRDTDHFNDDGIPF